MGVGFEGRAALGDGFLLPGDEAHAPADAFELGGGGVQGALEELGFVLRRGDAGHRADLGEGDAALRQGPVELRQLAEREGDTESFTRGSWAETQPPGQSASQNPSPVDPWTRCVRWCVREAKKCRAFLS